MNIPRSRTQVRLLAALAATTMLLATVLLAQESRDSAPPPIPDLARRQAEQTATILGLDSLIAKVHQVEASHSKDPVDAMTALMLRQELSESIQRASLDVDGVLAELTSERNRLGDLRAALQNRRGRTVARFNAIALITGSGVSAAVSATQFTSLGSRTQNAGDAIGIGSGVASTLFSILAVRKQHGPSVSIGETPNMLAPLLGGTPVLNTYYPPAVMRFLEAIPAGDPAQGTRLEQLKARWSAARRLDMSAPDAQRKIRAVATSDDPSVKVTIDDITDRIAMLGDVMGRVSLMKRDLGVILRSYSVLFADR